MFGSNDTFTNGACGKHSARVCVCVRACVCVHVFVGIRETEIESQGSQLNACAGGKEVGGISIIEAITKILW